MKIRIMGSADLVQAWKTALEAEYGIVGANYPSRGGEMRAYFDIDDRKAAEIVDLATPVAAPATPASAVVLPAARIPRRARLPRP